MKLRYPTLIAFSVCIISVVFIPTPSHADLIGQPGNVDITNTGNNTSRLTQLSCGSTNYPCDLAGTLNKFWGDIQNYVTLLAIVATIYLIWNGIRYMTSGSDMKKATEARQAIVQVVVAIALIISATFIVSLIWSFAVFLAQHA